MALGLKNFVVALAALLFGVGHSACACVQNSAAVPVVAEIQHHGSAGHGHAASGMAHHADHDGGAKPCDPSHESCEHCQAAQFASAPDAAKLGAPQAAPGAFIAILTAPLTAVANPPVLKATARLHWAAPPGLSPVSLKIRLLN